MDNVDTMAAPAKAHRGRIWTARVLGTLLALFGLWFAVIPLLLPVWRGERATPSNPWFW